MNQAYVFQDCYAKFKNPVPTQHAIDLDHLRSKPNYFGEALEICERFGLLPIMDTVCDYDVSMIAQFYATVHFGGDDEKTMKWMTNGRFLTSTWDRFSELLGYPLEETEFSPSTAFDKEVNGWRIHGGEKPSPQEVLAPLYIRGRGKPNKIKGLLPTYDIMNRVYLETLFVKGGNFDMIHAYHIDAMLQTHLRKDEDKKMDVMNVLFEELYMNILDRKACAYGPYIMILIDDAWKETYDEDIFKIADLTTHYTKRLLVKKHEDPIEPGTEPPQDDIPEADVGGSGPSHVDESEPSWVKKMMNKLKKSFCLKIDLQKRMYKEHEGAKKDRQRQKQIMRKLELPVSDGSEDEITPEEDWISKQQWSTSEDEAGEHDFYLGWDQSGPHMM
jgi:hypothetical protein